jgi:hypothetical protein
LEGATKTKDTEEELSGLPPFPLSRKVFAPHALAALDDGTYPPMHFTICCVTKFSIRAADLALCAKNITAFVISKGKLVEADIPSLEQCTQLKEVAFNFSSGSNFGERERGGGDAGAGGGGAGGGGAGAGKMRRVVFSSGAPTMPSSLTSADFGSIEDSEAHPCAMHEVLRLVLRLGSLKLQNIVLREGLRPLRGYATLQKLELKDMPGLTIGDAFWSACSSLRHLQITGPDSSKRTALGAAVHGCNPFGDGAVLPPSLRTIELERVEVRVLPSSVCACRVLAALVITGCGLRELPGGMSQLVVLDRLSLCSNELTVGGIMPLATCAFFHEEPANGLGGGETRTISLGGNESTLGDGVPTGVGVIAHLAALAATSGGDGLRRFSHADLASASSNFGASELIADDGSFGPVYHGKFGSSQHVAIKIMRDVTTHNDEQLRRELSVLRQCRHPNLVQLIGYSDDGPAKCIVYGYKARGCLRRMIESGSDELPWRRRICILSQVLSALEYLHTQVDPPIVHRDVKSGNILLDASLSASLGDFGLARISPEASAEAGVAASTRIFGTPGYVDPEYAQTGRVSLASDIFSLGVVTLELLSSGKPYDPSLDPAVLLDRFEEAGEDGTLAAFAGSGGAAGGGGGGVQDWPTEPALQLCAMVKVWTHRRGKRRPTAAAASDALLVMCEQWACSPIQLNASGRCGASCVVCDDEAATHAFIPCGHKCVCSTDAAEMIRRGMPCPMCRSPAERAVHIFE